MANLKLYGLIPLFFIFLSNLRAGPGEINGVVVNHLDEPLTGCQVGLANFPGFDITENGEFGLSGLPVGISTSSPVSRGSQIHGGRLYFHVGTKGTVKIALFDLSGRQAGGVQEQLDRGVWQMEPLAYISGPLQKTVYMVRLTIGAYTQVHRIAYTGSGSFMKRIQRSGDIRFLAKQAASVDTLVIECKGYTPEEIGIDTYTLEMGTIKVYKPNFLMILVDDMGYSDIGSYGSEIPTPNLDALAFNGLRFTQIYNTSKCFPSRACLLTGAYAQQVGMSSDFSGIKNGVTLGEVMKLAGYRTLASGKHHSRVSLFDRGFDRYYGLRDGACNMFNPGARRDGEPQPAQKTATRAWSIDDQLIRGYTPPSDFYTTDYFTNYALDYLEEYKDENNPFLLYLAYTAPHDPMMAWPEDIDRHRGNYSAGYEAVRQARWQKQQELGLWENNVSLSDPEFRNWDNLSTSEKADQEIRMTVYAAMVDRLDQNVGRVLDKLKELGKLDNTLILFASDNGGSALDVQIGSGEIGNIDRWSSVQGGWANVSNTPFRKYKNWSHEGGICTPFIAYWPKVIKNHGTIIREPGHFIDIMATLVDITDAPYPTQFDGNEVIPMQGRSMYPFFRGGQPKPRGKPIFWEWADGHAVRDGKWKAVKMGDPWELYDISVDRTETNNLSAEQPQILADMIQMWDDWWASTGL